MIRNRMGLTMVALSIALFVSACGNDQPAVVDESVVVESEADLAVATTEAVEDTAVVEESEATVDVETADAVSTSVMTDTVIDTDVITQVEVITETEVAEIIVEQQVMTDTDVTVNRDTDVESDVTVETEDVESASTSAIVLLNDAAGASFLGDPVQERPLFAGDQAGLIVDENFEPVEVSDEAIYGDGVDQGLFSETLQGDMRQLTYNGYPLYRYVGPDDGDWRTMASEQGLFQITPEGEMGEFAE